MMVGMYAPSFQQLNDDLVVSGGLTPYTWSNGLFTEDINNLPPGTYTINVSDG